jgi:hypothetical protein
MNKNHFLPRLPGVLALSIALGLAACGGGSDVSTGGTGASQTPVAESSSSAAAMGSVTGFGSVIVNGVKSLPVLLA